MKPHLFWDLDGTLTNPRVGIVRCVQYALQKANLPVPPEADLLWVIGPPLQDSFAQLAPQASESEVWELVDKYRERYSETGMFENEVYQGIPELLGSVTPKKNYLATSKAQAFARHILDHFQLAGFFHGAYGSEFDGRRSDKAELIQYILETEKIAAAEAVMIGDRKFDIIGAKKTGMLSIGITWGYGSREELESAGADAIVDSPEELRMLLLRG
jgi:phosphoglycolate phosphatase